MGKLLMFLSFLSIVITALGTAFFSHLPLFLLASDAITYQAIRATLATIMLLMLITHPPRNLYFRLIAGMLAIGIGAWVVKMTIAGTMLPLDLLSMLGAALAIGVTSLEATSVKGYKKHLPENTASPLIA